MTDLELEKLVLGSALLNNSQNWPVIVDLLSAADFSVQPHRRIFSAMAGMVVAGVPVDRVTVSRKLFEDGNLEEVGGVSYITSLDDGLPEIYNLDAYCVKLRERSIVRHAAFALQAGVARLLGVGAGLDDLREVQAAVAAFSTDQGIKPVGFRSVAEVIESPRENGGSFLQPSAEEVGLPWPWHSLTEAIGGIRAGQVTVIAAATGVGKTTAGTQILLHVAKMYEKPCALLSLEMDAVLITRKIVAQDGGVPLSAWLGDRLDDKTRRRIASAANQVRKMAIYIDTTPTVTPAMLDARIAAMKTKPYLLMVDYLQLMQSGIVDKSANREQHVAHISRQLRLIAAKHELALLALSQVNKEGEARESAAVMQDCTTCIRIDAKQASAVEFVVMKSRLTSRHRIPMHFDGAAGLFLETGKETR